MNIGTNATVQRNYSLNNKQNQPAFSGRKTSTLLWEGSKAAAAYGMYSQGVDTVFAIGLSKTFGDAIEIMYRLLKVEQLHRRQPADAIKREKDIWKSNPLNIYGHIMHYLQFGK